MLNVDKTVLITGATGRQGGAVIRHMLPKGWRLRALTRQCSSYAAERLAGQGVELVRGDLEDPASLECATLGVYGVFSVQDFWAVGAKREVQQGKNLAEAAKKAGVEYFVYSSVGGAERNSGYRSFGRANGKSKSTFENLACRRRCSGRSLSWRTTTLTRLRSGS